MLNVVCDNLTISSKRCLVFILFFFPTAEGDQVDENVHQFDDMEADGNDFEDLQHSDDEIHPSDVSDQADQSGSSSDPQGKSPI